MAANVCDERKRLNNRLEDARAVRATGKVNTLIDLIANHKKNCKQCGATMKCSASTGSGQFSGRKSDKGIVADPAQEQKALPGSIETIDSQENLIMGQPLQPGGSFEILGDSACPYTTTRVIDINNIAKAMGAPTEEMRRNIIANSFGPKNTRRVGKPGNERGSRPSDAEMVSRLVAQGQ